MWKNKNKKRARRHFFRWCPKSLTYHPISKKEEMAELCWFLQEEPEFYRLTQPADSFRSTNGTAVSNLVKETHQIFLSQEACYIQNEEGISFNKQKSKIYLSDKTSVLSEESTEQIMKRWFAYNQMSYEFMKVIADQLGFQNNCPYVSGNRIYIPECETNMSGTNWIALHKVRRNEPHPGGTTLFFLDESVIQSAMPVKLFERQVERAAKLYYLQALTVKKMILRLNLQFTTRPRDQNHLVYEWLVQNVRQIERFSLTPTVSNFYRWRCMKKLYHIISNENFLLNH